MSGGSAPSPSCCCRSATGENAVPAFDEYGHGAMLVDFDLQYAEEPAQAVSAAAQLLKQWVTVV